MPIQKGILRKNWHINAFIIPKATDTSSDL